MNDRVRLSCLFLAVGFIAMSSFAAEKPARETYSTLQQEMMRAYKAKDYAATLKSAQALYDFAHGGSRMTLNLAGINALAGKSEEAFRLLNAAAEMGADADLSADDDFAPLKNDPRFAAAQAKFAANRKPVSNSKPVATIADATLLTEDVTYDAKSRSYFLTSVRQKKIIRIAADGKQSDFADFSKNPGWPLFAIALDAKRRVLWVTAVAQPNFSFTPKGDEGRSALLKLNAHTGKLLARFDLPADGEARSLGDMTLLRDGSLIVSDSRSGAVYRFQGGKYTRIDQDEFVSPQTPAATNDSSFVFVSDYARGIARIDLAGRMLWLAHPDNVALNGVDGMYLRGNEIIAIQNGIEPVRVVRFRLNDAMDNVISADTLEANTPGLGEPTHGVFTADGFVVIANAGWDQLGKGGVPKADMKATAPALWRLEVLTH